MNKTVGQFDIRISENKTKVKPSLRYQLEVSLHPNLHRHKGERCLPIRGLVALGQTPPSQQIFNCMYINM